MPYVLPSSLTEALELRASGEWCVIAGGTDVYPARVEGARRPLLDLSALSSLATVEGNEQQWRIGPLVTWTQLRHTQLPACFDALKQAGREVGAGQIQNVATIAGNLCNASPAADGVPPLLVLDAEVELSSVEGRRVAALSDFILGNRRTLLKDNELVTAVIVPRREEHAPSRFYKLGSRRYLVISIAMVAAQIVIDETGCVSSARIAVGSCSEVATRLPELESSLVGVVADERIATYVTSDRLQRLAPIDDVRGSCAYRLEAAAEIIRRVLIDSVASVS